MSRRRKTVKTPPAEIVKEESIEVPAGKFKAVVVQIKHENAGRKPTTYWFVQDVGFVKHTYALGGLNVVLELSDSNARNNPVTIVTPQAAGGEVHL